VPKIRVLLIEDNRLLREGITAMLNEQPDIRVVSASGNGDVFEKAKEINPHKKANHLMKAVKLAKREHEVVDLIARSNA